jgi:glycolate oxidase FAD binding subunit
LQATIGGVLACNLSGPGRIKAGAARDHILGVKGVSGRGEAFKSGGRVVKNVTGYDLSKLIAGSFGTLAAMTELTLKVMPAAEKTYTVLIFGLDDEAALRVMGEAVRSRHEVSGLAHLPHRVAARSAVSYVGGAGTSVTALRTAGPGPSVEHRTRALREMFADHSAVEELHSYNSAVLWREVRDCARLLGVADSDGTTVWRLSVPPARGADVMATIMRTCESEAYYDWAGGLIWLALGSDNDGVWHEAIRRAVASMGGHALLVRADAAVRERIPVFEPQPEPLAQLTRRVKQSFDPKRVLNPGRMYAEL